MTRHDLHNVHAFREDGTLHCFACERPLTIDEVQDVLDRSGLTTHGVSLGEELIERSQIRWIIRLMDRLQNRFHRGRCRTVAA